MGSVKGFGFAGVAVLGVMLSGCETSNPYAARAALVDPVNCSKQTFEIYFAEGGSRLTPAATQAIAMTADRLKGCVVRSVSVTGLSDTSGTAAANLNLSEQRAQAVTEAMRATGWPTPLFDVHAAGNAGAVVNNVHEPMRRRTEVVVDAVPYQ